MTAPCPPHWSGPRILHRDAETLVVDKPAGVAAHPVDLPDVSDVGSRIEALLGTRPALLHALDRDASGTMVLALSKEASRGLSRQLESGVAATHVVATTARPKGLEHEVLRREGDRYLLRLRNVKGVRRALARAGAPIAGDRDQGGAPAPRLLWHAESLEVHAPSTGRPIAARSPIPGGFERWLASRARLEACDERVREAFEGRYALAARDDTDAYRLAHGAGDELPGVEIDVYGEYAVVSLASDEALERRDAIFDAVHALGFRGVYAKLRPRKASTLVDTRREDVAPSRPVRGEPAPPLFWVRELGVEYAVRLGDGLSTGLFLDQRAARGWLRREASGKSLLNLFAYHGAFTVAAIAGDARRSVTVDASGVALERAAENLEHCGANRDAHALVKADAGDWLMSCTERFDVVVLDPPSFSTTSRGVFRAERDYRKLSALSLARLTRGGVLLASTNLRRLGHEAFRKVLVAAAKDARRVVGKVRELPPPLDHPPPPGEPWHLKRVLVELED